MRRQDFLLYVCRGMLGWFVLIPAIVFFGGDSVLFPGTQPIPV